jgi:serine/threonine-protein kinase
MTADEWVGQIIAGKYRVEGLLGKGGMGLVLHARHVRLDEQVAIKILLPSMLEVPGMINRFLREARAASKIKSRHVARVTDVDVLPDGVPYMVMEYLDGMSLSSLRKREGVLEIHEAVRYVVEACDAIAEAHSLGIVHRDLKPANLFLARGRDGEEIIKVLDFGISKVDAPGEQDTTRTGQMMGSPKYMAPEQMLSMHDVDGRSDIWSLGAILYDLIAGRTPFVADTVAQLCSLVLNTRPATPRLLRADLPEGLEAIILRCLERKPSDRFADVAELVAALRPFAPPDTHISAPRGPSSSTLRLTGSWVRKEVALAPEGKEPADDNAGDDPKSTVAMRAEARPVSRTPLSARGATVSVWNTALLDRSSLGRRPRVYAVGFALAVALVVASGLALRAKSEPAEAAPTSGSPTALPVDGSLTASSSPSLAPSTASSSPSLAPLTASSSPSLAPPTASSSPPLAPLVSASPSLAPLVSAAASHEPMTGPFPRAPPRPPASRPTTVEPATQADPFEGRRR